MTKEYNFESYQKDTLSRPRDEAWSNWHSWKDAKIGDKVQGYVADAFYRPDEKNTDGTYAQREQRGITIRKIDGTLTNVGIKYLPFILVATDNLRIGDPLTIEFTKTLAPAQKGQQGAKIYSYYGTNLPQNSAHRTVKELTDEDKNLGGTKVASEEEIVADVDYDNFNEEPVIS